MVLAGLLLESAASISMGLVPRSSRAVFGYLFLRIMQGVGAAFSYTALLADVAERLPTSLGVVMGLQEAVSGIGFMVGPPLGGVMYVAAGGLDRGGMWLPFAVMGSGLLLGIPIIPLGMPASRRAASSAEHAGGGISSGQLLRLVAGNRSVLNAVACTVITGIAFGFVLPTLEPHLRARSQRLQPVPHL